MNATLPYSTQALVLHVLFVLLLSAGASHDLHAQPRSFSEAYDDYGPYGYHTPAIWELIRREYCGRADDRDEFCRQAEAQAEGTYFLCPWWVEDLYMTDSVAAARCGMLGYVGYVLDVWTGGQQQINEWNSTRCLLDHELYREKEFELVVFCRNRGFSYFLASTEAQLTFFKRVFDIRYGALNRTHGGRKASGLNLYLPGYVFDNKQNLTRFLHSLRMIVSNYGVKGPDGRVVRPYAKGQLPVTLTFPANADVHREYLATLLGYADRIDLIDYNEYGFPSEELAAAMNTENTRPPLFAQVLSLFHRIGDDSIYLMNEDDTSDSIRQLMQASYRSENWRAYFVANVVLTLFMLTLIILYNVYSGFYLLVQRLDFLVTPALMAYVGETMALLFYMLEAMTRGTQFFDITDHTYYLLLALPLLLFLAYAALRLTFRQKELP